MFSLDGGSLCLFLGHALGDESVVLCLLLLLVLDAAALEGTEVTATLETERSHETLDFGTARRINMGEEYTKPPNSRLGIRLRVLLLRTLDLPPDDILPHIVLLAQIEEFANLRRTLGSETFGKDGVGETGDVGVALLDDDEGEDGDVGADDAAADGLALALTGAAGTVA